MIFLTIVSVLVLFGVNIVSGEAQCSDCVLLRSCQGAKDYITKAEKNYLETSQKLINSYCGEQVINGVAAPKVCCSQFTTEHKNMTENEAENRFSNPDDNLKDNIESHPNLSLLPESCGGIDGNKIFGGTFANLYEFPWMALISHRTVERSGKTKTSFQCGGSIINSRYILSAAHCVTHLSNAEIAGVRVGEFDVRSKEDCEGELDFKVCETNIQDFYVEEIIPHEDYRIMLAENDIALIRLRNPINMTFKNAKPICLPIAKEQRDRQITSGTQTGTVAGWGFTETGLQSAVLKKVDIPILSAAACRELYNINSDPDSPDKTLNKICAGKIGKDSCRGDSGGPLMLEDEINGKYRTVQFGIVSFGPKQCGSSFPGVYTDVTKYMKWILDNIKA